MTAKAPLPLDPPSIPLLPPEEVSELLETFLSQVPGRSFCEVPSQPGRKALVFGDTHSDWPTVQALARRALQDPAGTWLMSTGDYVDRAPPELPFGSVINALYLLSLRLAHPDRVVLLRGNHETQRQLPILRNEVVDEARSLWGEPGGGIGDRILDAFDHLPLAATTESGAYLAHAGFPRERGKGGWKAALEKGGLQVLEEVVWNDLAVSSYAGGRGLEIPPISERETIEFLREADLAVFLRGHDPTEAGRARYLNRVLTLHTSRVYDWAGLHVAEFPLDGALRDLRDVVHSTLEPPPIPPVKLPAGARRQGK